MFQIMNILNLNSMILCFIYVYSNRTEDSPNPPPENSAAVKVLVMNYECNQKKVLYDWFSNEDYKQKFFCLDGKLFSGFSIKTK